MNDLTKKVTDEEWGDVSKIMASLENGTTNGSSSELTLDNLYDRASNTLGDITDRMSPKKDDCPYISDKAQEYLDDMSTNLNDNILGAITHLRFGGYEDQEIRSICDGYAHRDIKDSEWNRGLEKAVMKEEGQTPVFTKPVRTYDNQGEPEFKKADWGKEDVAYQQYIIKKGYKIKRPKTDQPKNTIDTLKLLFEETDLLAYGEDVRFGSKCASLAEIIEDGILPAECQLCYNPRSSRVGITQEGKESHKCKDNDGNRKYFVVEFDHLSDTHQQAGLHAYLAKFAPLCMVMSSGGKSLHGIYDVEDQTETETLQFVRLAVRLGADTAMCKKSQFGRMPFALRLDKDGAQQKLIAYYSPEERSEYDLNGINQALASLVDEVEEAEEDLNNPLPLDCFPPVVADMIKEVAKATETPTALAATSALAVMSTACGRGVCIDTGRGVTYANTMIMVEAESGTGKGITSDYMLAPIRAEHADRIKDHNDRAVPEAKAKIREVNKRLKELDKVDFTGTDNSEDHQSLLPPEEEGGDFLNDIFGDEEEVSDVEGLMQTIDEEPTPESGLSEVAQLEKDLADNMAIRDSNPRMVVEDITPEALAHVMYSNDGHAASVVSSEGKKTIDVILGRYSGGETDETTYLKMYAGEGMDIARKGGGSMSLPYTCGSMWLAVQPAVVRKLASKAQLTDTGLTARWLWCNPHVGLNKVSLNPYKPNKGVINSWDSLVRGVCKDVYPKGHEPVELDITQEVFHHVVNWGNEYIEENNTNGTYSDMLPCVARWMENSWRLCLVLHMMKGNGLNESISLATAESATKLMAWFIKGQLQILDEYRANKRDERKEKLVEILGKCKDNRKKLSLLKFHNYYEEGEIIKIVQENPDRFLLVESTNTRGPKSKTVVLLGGFDG